MPPAPPAPSGVPLPGEQPRPTRPELLPLLGLAVAGGVVWWWQLGLPAAADILQVAADAAPLGILAVAMTLLLASGAVDLGLGALAVIAAVAAARLPALAGVTPAVGVVIGVAAAGLLGGLDGAAVTITRRPAWLVTGAMLVGYAGLSGLLLGMPQLAEAAPVRWALLDWRSPELALDAGVLSLVLPSLPLALWCWLALLVLVPLLLHGTVGGNRMMALGASPAVAKALGLSVLRTRLALFAAAGLLAGLSGLLQPLPTAPVEPLGALGSVVMALAAAVIGGALGRRGREAFLGGALALLLLALAGRQLGLSGLPPAVALMALGALLLLALGLGAGRRSIAVEVA